jgi:hydrogenase maturation factor
MLAAVLLPPGSTRADAQTVLADLESACAGLGVFLIGGHTEVTPAVTQPVVAACMVGDVEHDRLVRSGGAQAGDSLLLAGSVALEGTAILAREYVDILRGRGVNEGTIAEAAGLLDHPGISVLPAVRALTGTVLPHAMHDPTEGGVLGAAREMALASGLGLRIDAQSVPVLVSCEEICAALGLDPLRLLASGSLLAAVDPRDESAALRALHDAGIEAAAIGTMPSTVDTILLQDGREGALPETDRDELARWIESRANR